MRNSICKTIYYRTYQRISSSRVISKYITLFANTLCLYSVYRYNYIFYSVCIFILSILVLSDWLLFFFSLCYLYLHFSLLDFYASYSFAFLYIRSFLLPLLNYPLYILIFPSFLCICLDASYLQMPFGAKQEKTPYFPPAPNWP